MSDTNVSDYQKGLVSLSDTVGKTLIAAVRAREEYAAVNELQEASTRLKAELDLISNTLGTIMNWIRLQETALAALASLQEWASVAATESDLDAIRHRMRIMIQPQIESFVQSISSADKASRVALPFMSEDLTKIPSLIKKISDINLHMLELIEYEPSTKTSLLDSGINALYRGAIQDFQTKLERLEKNSDIMEQQTEK
ncbi:MAG: hypothetical protein ACFFGZ_05415 [Candidatus Thorarchaeota archaeon]